MTTRAGASACRFANAHAFSAWSPRMSDAAISNGSQRERREARWVNISTPFSLDARASPKAARSKIQGEGRGVGFLILPTQRIDH